MFVALMCINSCPNWSIITRIVVPNDSLLNFPFGVVVVDTPVFVVFDDS
jgi:hypothetical protein